MTGKIVLFFLVAFCATQGMCSPAPESRSIQDIIDTIKDIVKKIEDALSEITNKIPEILENLKDKIKEIISSIDVDAIIAAIDNQIMEILNNAGIDISDAVECKNAEGEAVKQLIEATTQGLVNCKDNASDQITKLEEEVEALKNKAKQMIEDSKENVDKCVKENGLHPVEILKCLKEHLADFQNDAMQLVEQIKDVVKKANETAIQVPIELTKCVAKVNSNAIAMQKKIIEDFKTCVEEKIQ